MALNADTMTNGEHYLGLDVLRVETPSGRAECAMLVEVWKTGVLVYTSEPIPAGTRVRVSAQGNMFQGVVDSCEQDPYGQLVSISISREAGWFPGAYTPPYVMPMTPKPSVLSTASGL